jgi:CubicO group peptidase (beta-lactamase class C family)
MARARILKTGLAALALMLAAYLIWDWRFWERHLRAPGDATLLYDIDWYTPRTRISNGMGWDIPRADPGTSRFDPAALAAAVDYARSKDSYAFLVLADGRIEAEFYKDGFGPETLFDTQSMHKGLLALAFGVMVDRGTIPSIDVPAATYLPEWRGDARAAITIRDLLANVSGLAEPPYGEWPWSQSYRLFMGTDVDGLVLKVPAVEPPRTRYVFNHVNSQVLHAILTRASGLTYAEFIRRYLWTPLGNGAAQVRLDREGGAARVVCCFQTQARSWARLALMLLDGGKVGATSVISPDWIAQATTPTVLNPHAGFHVVLGRPEPRGGGIARAQPTRASEPFAAPDVFYLEGRGGQRTLWIPSRRIAVVRIGRIDFAWDDAKVINPLIAGLK